MTEVSTMTSSCPDGRISQSNTSFRRTSTSISASTIPWAEKYRPKMLNDITQDENIISLFKNYIKTKNMLHLLLYGPPGTGKTSTIRALGRELFKEQFATRVIEFNASDDRGINAVREKITGEARKLSTEATSIDGTVIPAFKIIILDEADAMTDEAQDALRVIIEQYSGVTRFCFICNYISKITDAIKSRCSKIYFKKLTTECMITKLNEIAASENMELEENILKTIIEVSNGDMRKAIAILQDLKYLYSYKKTLNKNISEMSMPELQLVSTIGIKNSISSKITPTDICNIAAFIDLNHATKIINHVMKLTNIISINAYTKDVIAMGFPTDNILTQLNKALLKHPDITDIQKAHIFKYTASIFYKIKECGNEYIQLLDYLSCVSGITRGRQTTSAYS